MDPDATQKDEPMILDRRAFLDGAGSLAVAGGVLGMSGMLLRSDAGGDAPSAVATLRSRLTEEARTQVAAMEAKRALAWPGYAGEPFVRTFRARDAASLLDQLAAARAARGERRWFRVLLDGDMLDGDATALGEDWDFGGSVGGGVLIEASDPAALCRIRLNLRAPNGLHIRNATFVGPNAERPGALLQFANPSRASTANSARLVVENCRFGALWDPALTPLDWKKFPSALEIHHGHTVIFRNNLLRGVYGGAEIRSTFFGEASRNYIRQFLGTTFGLGIGYNEDQLPVLGPGADDYTFWGHDNVWAEAWDRSDLYFRATGDIPHTDMFQTKPTNMLGWRGRFLGEGRDANGQGTQLSPGDFWVMPNGQVYQARIAARRGEDPPAHVNGATIGAWRHVGAWSARAFNIVLEGNFGAVAPVVPAGYDVNLDRNQLMLFMDSARDRGVGYPGSVTIIGNRLSSNGAYGVISQGMTLIAEHNTQVSPADGPLNRGGLPGGAGQPFRGPMIGCESNVSNMIARNNLGFNVSAPSPGFSGKVVASGNRIVDFGPLSSGGRRPSANFGEGVFTRRDADGYWFCTALLEAARGGLNADQVRAAIARSLTPTPRAADAGAV
jgi:hypothetical protein